KPTPSDPHAPKASVLRLHGTSPESVFTTPWIVRGRSDCKPERNARRRRDEQSDSSQPPPPHRDGLARGVLLSCGVDLKVNTIERVASRFHVRETFELAVQIFVFALAALDDHRHVEDVHGTV